MGHVATHLRQAGAGAVLGLLGLVVAFLSSGLAVVALDSKQEISVAAASFFVLAGVAGLSFIASWIFLARSHQKKETKLDEMRELFNRGYARKTEIFQNGDPEPFDALNAWHADVVAWLNAAEPRLEPEFSAASPGLVAGHFNHRTGPETAAILSFEAYLDALVNLMREVRSAP